MKRLALVLIFIALITAYFLRPSLVLPIEPSQTVRVVFGYKDARPARFVGDRYERGYILAALEEFGFKRDPKDDDHFTLENIDLRLVHSSVGPDDDENRRDPWQEWHSDYAARTFFDGLGSADVVMYIGHSRIGGGPDFTPPRLAKSGKVDYAFYKNHPVNYEKMKEALRGKTPAKTLGLYSCASSQHFARGLKECAPKLEVISSAKLLYYSDSLEQVREALRKIATSPPVTKD